ncbi:PQ loop repeat-domain-containing protein [Polychytrium aggregatum]|uniref:PQ loop repeat-domain-containing protein n=1 Tax=Polychytrium aggregatum TaxID=110093 RepID=UPI0022FF079F|nr:PQ loop repeat-domain-containing protein [Polychytrium aggregatum]KAI9199838.1 PQ loop repeat-domain-containing protein [Polychytrium aggregatum]
MFIVLSLSTALLQPAIQALGSAVLRLNTGDSALGTWIAYLCAACYLVSRLPQIYRNHQRKSVQGLSIGMFSLAVFGNLSYALSVICKCVPEPWRLQAAFPFILGSMGTIIFDAVILLQCWIYRPHRYLAEEVSFRSS